MLVGAWGPIIGPTWSCGPDPAPTVIEIYSRIMWLEIERQPQRKRQGEVLDRGRVYGCPTNYTTSSFREMVRGNEIRLYSCHSGGTLAVAFCCREIWVWPFTPRWFPSVSPPQPPALFCPHLLFLSSATLQVTAPCGFLSHPPPPGSSKLLPSTSSDAGEDAIHVNGGIQGAQSPQPL